jgi:hypothetical protein
MRAGRAQLVFRAESAVVERAGAVDWEKPRA